MAPRPGEGEVEVVLKYDSAGRSVKNGPKMNTFTLVTKRGEGTWVAITLIDDGRIGEDLKKYAYSLAFQPGREEPVKVPPDVRAFLDMWCADVVSHDVEAMMAHHSDRFLHSGANKAVMEQLWRTYPSSPVLRRTISSEATVTVFEPRGDKAYIDGFRGNGHGQCQRSEVAYDVPADHQRTRPVEVVWKSQVVSHGRRTGERIKKAPPSILQLCQEEAQAGGGQPGAPENNIRKEDL